MSVPLVLPCPAIHVPDWEEVAREGSTVRAWATSAARLPCPDSREEIVRAQEIIDPVAAMVVPAADLELGTEVVPESGMVVVRLAQEGIVPGSPRADPAETDQ